MYTSVALCTYNGETFLEEQLRSIFSQTIPVDEVIVCDEGSSDNTINIIDQFATQFPGIIHLNYNQQKLGVVKNFQQALQLCKGDVIFFCDQDDVWQSNKVEGCLNFFSDHPSYLAVFSDATLVDDSTQELGQTMWDIIQFKETATKKPGLNVLEHLVFHGNIVTGACLAVKKEARQLILPFDEIGGLYHDEIIALKLAKEDKIAFLNKALIKYRLHGNQQSKVIRHRDRKEVNAIKQAVIRGDINYNPLEYYRYWKRRMKAIDFLKLNGIDVGEDLVTEVRSQRKQGLIAYYKTFNFYKRKKALLHELLKGRESISLNDVLVR